MAVVIKKLKTPGLQGLYIIFIVVIGLHIENNKSDTLYIK